MGGGEVGGGGGEARVSDFIFTKNPNLKQIFFVISLTKDPNKKNISGGGRGGRGFFFLQRRRWCGGGEARISVFFPKNPNEKNIFFSGEGGGDEQAQTNLPLQLLRSWGHNNA